MIFISGGGNYNQTQILDKVFFKKSEKILYIPLGLDRNFSGYEGCYEWFLEVAKYHLFNSENIKMYINLEYLDWNTLDAFDSIYIGGTSDMLFLKKRFQQSNFISKLNDFYKAGKHIYGGSGGGVILGQTIDLKDSGFKILPFSILTHYDNNTKLVKEYFSFSNSPLIVLNENSGISYIDKTVTSLGQDSTIVYLSRTEKHCLRNNEVFKIITNEK